MKTNTFKLIIVSIVACALIVTGLLVIPGFREGSQFTIVTMDGIEQITISQINRLEPLTIRFAEPLQRPAALAQAVSLRPKVQGSWSCKDDRTIEFTPSRPYAADSQLILSVDTGVLMGGVSGDRGFITRFDVNPQSITVIPGGLVPSDKDANIFVLDGVVSAGIPISQAEARKAVRASLGKNTRKQNLDIIWEREGESTTHAFRIESIARRESDELLTLSWKDASRGEQLNEKTWLVPKRDEFRVIEVAQEGPATVKVLFSELLDSRQDIRGFVRIGNEHNVRYSINKNSLTVYGKENWIADQKIEILEGLQSDSGKVLMVPVSSTVSSSWDKPAVRFVTDGVILPTTDGVVLPIETLNLSGVLIEAHKIHGDNVLQFLQVNELDGSRELRRVSDPIWTKSINFDWNEGMKNRYVPRGLDLSELVKKDPGAILQIKVTFRKRHTKYVCTRGHRDFSSLPEPPDSIGQPEEESEQSYWDYAEEMDYDTRREYRTYRDDPCHPAYYMSEYNSSCVASRTVLVSNLGIMIKKDVDGAFAVSVADIGTTNPIGGADITFYSYAQGKILTGVTNKDGFFSGKAKSAPYFITAHKGGKTSYLRIDDGTSLSVSHFPIDGVSAEKGVKGFIYGERGVWRPGDDIHLVFVRQDLSGSVPKDFPITFELESPNGSIRSTQVISDSVDGFYRIDTRTDEDDESGSWVARVKAGGQTWTKYLRVEAVVPNRLSINLQTDNAILTQGQNNFTLQSAWLHGAPAPDYKADVWVSFVSAPTVFDGYSDYTFTDPRRGIEENNRLVWEGSLNKKSTANVTLDLDSGRDVPGKLKAMMTTRVFEPSGMFSAEQVAYPFSPYNAYVGIKLPKGDATRGMLLTDVKHRIDLAVVDAEGHPIKNDVPLTVKLYKLEWRWWWEKDALTDASYVSHSYDRVIAEDSIVAKKGSATWTMEVKYPEWGRYLAVVEDPSGGHRAGKIVYIDWPGWAGRGGDSGSGSAAMLPLSSDKNTYTVGNTAEITFAANENARALVTLEKNGRILKQEWVKGSKGTTVWKCPITAEMAPNVYAHVTLLQPHMQTVNSLPIRLYGILPLMVEDPATRLKPMVLAPEEYSSGREARFKVLENNGKPMTYTVAVVDEGLLGLTRFTAPNPWYEFYQKERSSLASWDLYRYVMSAYGGKLETILSVGGGEDMGAGNQAKAQRFKPVVLFLGPFELGKGETKEHVFKMPNYIGAVRLMVVAGKKGAYGTAEKQVPVREKLMILSTLPRTLGSNEKIKIPITIFNGQPTKSALKVSLKSTGALVVNESLDVVIDAGSDKTVTLPVSTTVQGKAVVTVAATAIDGSVTATNTTEIQVVSRGSPTVTTRSFYLKAGESKREFVPSPGESGSKAMSIEVSKMPVLDIQSRLSYLLTYPHGCIEQITSGGFPQLYIPSMIDMSPEETDTIKRNVLSVIERYSGYQAFDGGFSYWPSGGESNPWGSCYAGHFMLEAKKAGYEIPQSLYAPWLKYQTEQAKAFNSSNDRDVEVQAYRLYTLALSGNADIGSMNRLRQQNTSSVPVKWLLAGAYYLSGQRSQAAELVRGLAVELERYRDTGSNWGSTTRDQALVLAMMNVLGETNRSIGTLAKVTEALSSSSWYSTQETAWMLMSLAPHYSLTKVGNTAWRVEWDKGELEGVVTKGTVIRDLEPFDSPTQTVLCKNTGTEPLYARIVTKGILPAGEEKALENGVQASVRYVSGSGRNVRVSDLAVGDSFTMIVTCRNTSGKTLNNLVLSVPVPTCWEFANERIGMEGSSSGSSSSYDYKDIKDTHIYTYFQLQSSQTKTFRYIATVVYEGQYYVPAVRLEAMYDGDIVSVVPGTTVR